MTSHEFIENRDQRLRQPERKDQLRSGHQKLGRQTLEEAGEALVLHHVRNDTETALGVLEVAVLDAGLDNVERSRDNERSTGAGDRSDEVLAPRRLVVVAELENVLLGKSRATEKLKECQSMRFRAYIGASYSERAGRVASSSPAPTPVETKAFVLNDAEETASPESLGVRLALDLKNVERENDDFTDTNKTARMLVIVPALSKPRHSPASRGVHDSLAGALAECTIKGIAVVLGQVVPHEGLTTVLVHSLENLKAISLPTV